MHEGNHHHPARRSAVLVIALAVALVAALAFAAAMIRPTSANAATTATYWMVKDKSTGHALVTKGNDPTALVVVHALGASSASEVQTCSMGTDYFSGLTRCAGDLQLSLDQLPTGFYPKPGTDLQPLNHDLVTPLSPAVSSNAYQQGVSSAGSAAQTATDPLSKLGEWAMSGAQSAFGWVLGAATDTTTPELSSSWFGSLYAYLAAIGAGLAGVFAMIGLAGALLRRNSDRLGEVAFGVLRAGLLTSMAVGLTVIALAVVDGMSGDIVKSVDLPKFFHTLESALGSGLAAGLLTFIVGLVATFVGLLLWIELLVRDAAIVLAVLFLPVALAASIWPSLTSTTAKLVRLLAVFVVLKVVVLLVLMIGIDVLGNGATFGAGAGSIGTIGSGLVILGIAAFAPWTLLHLLGLEAGSVSRQSAGRSSSSSSVVGGELVAGSANGVGGRDYSVGTAGASAKSGGVAAGAAGAVGGALAGAVGAGRALGQHGAARIEAATGGHGSAPAMSGPSWGGFSVGSGGGGSAGSSSSNGSKTPVPVTGVSNGHAAGGDVEQTFPGSRNGHASTNGHAASSNGHNGAGGATVADPQPSASNEVAKPEPVPSASSPGRSTFRGDLERARAAHSNGNGNRAD